MPVAISTFIVATRGVGKPDYTREVAAGQIRPGISLKANQQLMQFRYVPTDQVAFPYLVPFIRPVLAVGAMEHIYDVNTGLATPYTLSAGYTLILFDIGLTFNQDVEMWLYFDGFLSGCLAIESAGKFTYASQVVGISSALVDPTGLTAHTVDIQIFNRGLATMKGTVQFNTILESVGTPPFPTEKDTICPFCSTINNVPVHTTRIICRVCIMEYFVYDTTAIRSI